MKTSYFWRLLMDIVIFFSVINGWWFITLPIVIIGFWFQKFYIEGLFAGVAYDGLFGTMDDSHLLVSYFATISTIIIWIVLKIFKKMIRK